MKDDPRTASVLAAITARYPGTSIETRPNRDPATWTDIPDIVWVLDVPPDLLREVQHFGLEVAFAVFGDDPLPFLIGTVDPERTAKHYRRAPEVGRVSPS